MTKPRLSRAARAAAALAAALFIVLLPDVASAGTTVQDHTVLPLLDCVTANADGSYDAVLGYDNTSSSTVTLPLGPENNLAPKPYDGTEPTSFAAGVQQGVFSVHVTTSPAPTWQLNGGHVTLSKTGPTCPPPTEMPATGNGTGLAIALLGAGVVGALAVARLRRRARRAGGTGA